MNRLRQRLHETRRPICLVAHVSVALALAWGGEVSAQYPPVPPERLEQLARAVIPFDGTHLGMPHGDIEFLRDIVGDARVVALGEDTHGTRDFFEMKARVLRFLVEEMDFDAFAIEASWPESNRLDAYVRTGVGDPAELLNGLYFWTWRTESVLEMIEWMRSYNAAGGDVGFYGFDMQFPGMAIWSVERFMARVDPAGAREVGELLSCLKPFANGPGGFSDGPGFRAQPPAFRDACYADLRQASAVLESRRDSYVAASSEDDFALAARSARVAEQFAEMFSGPQGRDRSMAENATWLLDRLGPGAKIVLWAHNFHVSESTGAMGSYLRSEYGDDLVTVGFTHSAGSFTARSPAQSGGDGYVDPLRHELDPNLPLSYEQAFSELGLPRFVLDLRHDDGTGLHTWLRRPKLTRGIGAVYSAEGANEFWSMQSLPLLYDVVIHIETTRATTLIPRRMPGAF